MTSVECPYCNKEVEINHDDGQGYEEDVIHFQECDCGNTFSFNTGIIYVYSDVKKCPCQNGEPHDWKQMTGFPAELFKNRKRCSYCDEKKSDV